MIIYCGLDGKVSSVPSTFPMGTILDDVVIITPQANVTATLRVKPAYQSYLPEIICSPVINEDHAVAFKAKIEKSVTGTAGRAEYQVILTEASGKAVASYSGSFNVSRGVMVDMPEDVDHLENYSLAQIYELLTNVTTVYNMLVNVENVIGMPNEELETTAKTLISAINELNGIMNVMKFEEAKREKAEKEREEAEKERRLLYEILKNSCYLLNKNVDLKVDENGNGSIYFIGMVFKDDGHGNYVLSLEGDPETFGTIVFEEKEHGNYILEVK